MLSAQNTYLAGNMKTQNELIADLDQLQANLTQTLGQLVLFEEQKHIIREEIAKVQGKLEILNSQTKPPDQ
jgi:hypothetical protein